MSLTDIPRRSSIYLPQTVEHVSRIVRHAGSRGWRVRVHGSGHSVPDAITDTRDSGICTLVLEGELKAPELISAAADGGSALVRVGAGCHLGRDPSDPRSTWDNSFNKWLDERGWALPLLGGLSHQTVAGFLLTGSSGGSLRHGLSDVIHAIEFVDGAGEVRTFTRPDDNLNGVAVSMGLMGVVTRVTVDAVPSYFVKGSEENVTEDNSWIAAGKGRDTPDLERLLRDVEYLHFNWFPQKHVRRVMQWEGRQAPRINPPIEYHNTLRTPLQAAAASAALFTCSAALAAAPSSGLTHRMVGALLRPFLPLDPPKSFQDHWWRALPSDDEVPVDRSMKTEFTEIWLPVEHSSLLVSTLRDMYTDQATAGNFAMEIYGAKRSTFWLSPAHARDVVRADPYWWAKGVGSSRAYFTRFWNRLLDLPGARLHWGKHMPDVGQQCGATRFGPDQLRAMYPRLPDWLDLRHQIDPNQVFVSPYWKRHLGL